MNIGDLVKIIDQNATKLRLDDGVGGKYGIVVDINWRRLDCVKVRTFPNGTSFITGVPDETLILVSSVKKLE